MFPEIDGGAALAEGLPGGLCAVFIKELDYLKPGLNLRVLGVIQDVIDALHASTTTAPVVTIYIDLFHLASPFSPPRESNMYLNFCIVINIYFANTLQIITKKQLRHESGFGLSRRRQIFMLNDARNLKRCDLTIPFRYFFILLL